MDTEKTFLMCCCIVLVCAIGGCTTYNIASKRIYADSLNNAVAHGQDPMVVGCAWGFSQTGEAAVCALNQGKR